jgi:hypothetical protein
MSPHFENSQVLNVFILGLDRFLPQWEEGRKPALANIVLVLRRPIADCKYYVPAEHRSKTAQAVVFVHS